MSATTNQPKHTASRLIPEEGALMTNDLSALRDRYPERHEETRMRIIKANGEKRVRDFNQRMDGAHTAGKHDVKVDGFWVEGGRYDHIGEPDCPRCVYNRSSDHFIVAVGLANLFGLVKQPEQSDPFGDGHSKATPDELARIARVRAREEDVAERRRGRFRHG